ncbi:MAG: GNAT family N-acetyltransferase [Candidatus Aminicenantales bacterium]|jgi:ribosomal protein S18 acetylase RimI-like enzyme
MKTTTLKFASISHYQPGALSALIHKSYAGLIQECPEYWEQEGKKWDDFDRQSFAHPDTIGKCVFVSCLDDQSIGLASYDPRHGPRYGLIGQNCVLPEYRGRGFGKQQILEILGRFGESQTSAARVSTSEHPFFMPAQKMYQSLGFKETRRFVGGPDPRYKVIELEIDLLTPQGGTSPFERR